MIIQHANHDLDHDDHHHHHHHFNRDGEESNDGGNEIHFSFKEYGAPI